MTQGRFTFDGCVCRVAHTTVSVGQSMLRLSGLASSAWLSVAVRAFEGVEGEGVIIEAESRPALFDGRGFVRRCPPTTTVTTQAHRTRE